MRISVSCQSAQMFEADPPLWTVPLCGFCKMLADRTAPREQASRSTLPRFNYLIESNGTLVIRPCHPRARSSSRFPRDTIPPQMRVTSDKSFRT